MDIIQITEQDLHAMINESLQRYLVEADIQPFTIKPNSFSWAQKKTETQPKTWNVGNLQLPKPTSQSKNEAENSNNVVTKNDDKKTTTNASTKKPVTKPKKRQKKTPVVPVSTPSLSQEPEDRSSLDQESYDKLVNAIKMISEYDISNGEPSDDLKQMGAYISKTVKSLKPNEIDKLPTFGNERIAKLFQQIKLKSTSIFKKGDVVIDPQTGEKISIVSDPYLLDCGGFNRVFYDVRYGRKRKVFCQSEDNLDEYREANTGIVSDKKKNGEHINALGEIQDALKVHRNGGCQENNHTLIDDCVGTYIPKFNSKLYPQALAIANDENIPIDVAAKQLYGIIYGK